MSSTGSLRRIAEWYIRRSCFVGVLFGVVPAILWFGYMFATIPFREVYVLRLGLTLVIAGTAGCFLNRYGMNYWLLKHRSSQGPAGIVDGMMIGAAIGFGIALLPPLTALIRTNHLEEAKWFIIGAWLAAVVIGGICGAVAGAIGRNNVSRETK